MTLPRIPDDPKPEIVALIDRLSLKNRLKVLTFMKTLPLIPEGTSGKELAEAMAQLEPLTPEESAEMMRIIQDIEDGKL